MPAPGWAVAINLVNGPAYISSVSARYARKLAQPTWLPPRRAVEPTISLAGGQRRLRRFVDRIGPNIQRNGWPALALILFRQDLISRVRK
jgi:hypothetical protein